MTRRPMTRRPMTLLVATIAIAIPACSSGSKSSAPHAATAACPVVFLGARGSGEDPQPTYNSGDFGVGALNSAVFSALAQKYPDLSPTPLGVQYPAVALAKGSDVPLFVGTAGGALFNVDTGQLGRYNQSVQAGITWLTSRIEASSSAAGCPPTRYVLSGFSQGAQVVADMVTALPSQYRGLIAGVVLFGDPQFNGHSAADRSTFDANRNGALTGVTGPRPEYPSWLVRNVSSFCHADDPVCQLYEHTKNGYNLTPSKGMAANVLTGDPLRAHKDYASSSARDVTRAVSDLVASITRSS
jgi:hypothetical protein